MKRDMDLCREILRTDSGKLEHRAPVKVAVEGRSDDEITYQLHILRQAELIEAIEAKYKGGMTYIPLRLTSLSGRRNTTRAVLI